MNNVQACCAKVPKQVSYATIGVGVLAVALGIIAMVGMGQTGGFASSVARQLTKAGGYGVLAGGTVAAGLGLGALGLGRKSKSRNGDQGLSSVSPQTNNNKGKGTTTNQSEAKKTGDGDS